MRGTYFIVEDTPYYKGWVIRPVHDALGLQHTEGSYNILAARVMDLGFADYLRMCRDIYHAEIYGKNSMYPVAVFKDKILVNELVKVLNAKMSLVMTNRHIKDMEKELLKNTEGVDL